MTAVLVLEDDDFMLDTLLGILEDAGYQATGAASSKEAIKSASLSRFDLMVCDIRMEGSMDGISTVHYIKSHFLPQLLVLMMTGYADDLSPYRAMEAEVDAYIFKKDFKTSSLLWAMENALRQRQQKTIFRKLFEPILSAPRRLLQTQDKARYDKALEKLDEGRLSTYRRFMVGIQSRQLEFRPALDIWDEFDKLERVYPILDTPPGHGRTLQKIPGSAADDLAPRELTLQPTPGPWPEPGRPRRFPDSLRQHWSAATKRDGTAHGRGGETHDGPGAFGRSGVRGPLPQNLGERIALNAEWRKQKPGEWTLPRPPARCS